MSSRYVFASAAVTCPSPSASAFPYRASSKWWVNMPCPAFSSHEATSLADAAESTVSFSPAASGSDACTYTGDAERTSIPPSLSPEKHASRNTRTDFASAGLPRFVYRRSIG